MTVPISGPKGKGTLYVEATAENDDGTYQVIRVEIDNSEIFEIIEDPELEQF